MYDELVKRLRSGLPCYGEKCLSCPDRKHCVTHYEHEAADAIEELSGFVQEAERDRDEYRARLDKANDAIEELQKLNWELLFRCSQAEALIDYYQTGKLQSNEPPKEE